MDRKISVLLVDDSAELCESLKLNLERFHGFSVATAQEGQSALRLARTTIPDIVLLDVMMPGLSGGQVAEMLRETPSTARIPIVFLTGMLSKRELEEQGGEIGGEIFLAKPVGAEEIAATIHTVLRR
jgi:Response regulators consisting of a CheY-like receiver domain and a winged-helix DNA-binding domain